MKGSVNTQSQLVFRYELSFSMAILTLVLWVCSDRAPNEKQVATKCTLLHLISNLSEGLGKTIN